MNELTLLLADDRRAYCPGEELAGVAAWQLARAPAALEVRLCWFTSGLAIAEARCVDKVSFDRPSASERRQFSFRLPEVPWSFHGALAALGWAVELVALPGQRCSRVEFTLGPRATPISLVQPPEYH